MVVDTSVIIALVQKEPDWQQFVDRLVAAPALAMSAASWVEVGVVVLARLPHAAVRDAEEIRRDLAIRLSPVDEQQAALAWTAFRRYGRGRHRAGLNIGDCFAYALARSRAEPLLFRGDDFARTDIEPAGVL